MLKKHIRRFTTIGLVLFVTPVIATVFSSDQLRAFDGSCATATEIYSATISVPSDTYAVYIKLARAGQVGNVSVSVPIDGSRCQPIGQGTVSGNEWSKIGEIDTRADAGAIQFNLASGDLAGGYEYDRPTLLLVSQSTPACVPTVECFVTINDEQAALRPTSTEADTGTLQIFSAQSIEGQPIKEVRYYVDGVLMYKTEQLEAFNPQFIPYYGHATARVIEFENGQTAVIEEPVPAARTDSPGAMFARSITKYQSFLLWVACILGLFIVFHIVHHIIKAIAHRHYWLYAHGFIKEEPTKPVSASRLYHIYQRDRIRRVASGLGVIALIGLIGIAIVLVLDSYIVRLTTVSGSSMERSLQDGQQILVDKTGVTFARVNQTDFIPERGKIVAAYLVSRFETQEEVSDQNIMIKRAIGLPGERVVIEGNTVTIYNGENPEGFDPSVGTDWAATLIAETDMRRLDIKLGNDEVFVIGDNRPGSIDSRANGPLLLRNIIGVVHE